MAEDLVQSMRPRQNYVMSNNDNDGKLADTIYIISENLKKKIAQNYLGQVSVSVSLFHRTLLGYYAEWMHTNY